MYRHAHEPGEQGYGDIVVGLLVEVGILKGRTGSRSGGMRMKKSRELQSKENERPLAQAKREGERIGPGGGLRSREREREQTEEAHTDSTGGMKERETRSVQETEADRKRSG